MSDISRTVSPEDCSSMPQVRAGVDAVDLALVELLTRRFAYMSAAARIKADRSAVRDEARKAQVLQNVKLAAASHGLPVDIIEQLWDQLVEASIAYEYGHWDAQHAS
jgi:isochorismate pyruvate lyase